MYVVQPDTVGRHLTIAEKDPSEESGGWDGYECEGKFVPLGKGQHGWKLVLGHTAQEITEEGTVIYRV